MFAPERNPAWVTSTLSAAIARSESISGKRGLPGGGATTGSAVDTRAQHTLRPVRFPEGFVARLALILAGALGIRVLYTLLVAQDIAVIGDALTYHLLGEKSPTARASSGRRIRSSRRSMAGSRACRRRSIRRCSALVGLITKLGANGYLAQKLVLCLVGTATVAFVGLAGREAAGPSDGLVAAGIAAIYPFLWVVDGSLMSETLYGALLAATMWSAIRFARRPHSASRPAIGALAALAALTRGEALLLVPLLLIPLAIQPGQRGARALSSPPWPWWRSDSCSLPGRSAT